jgi:hypothetical protein
VADVKPAIGPPYDDADRCWYFEVWAPPKFIEDRRRRSPGASSHGARPCSYRFISRHLGACAIMAAVGASGQASSILPVMAALD